MPAHISRHHILCAPLHPWLAQSLLAFSLLSGSSYISVVAVIPLCHLPWTDGEYTGSRECSPVAARHLLQCLTDVTAHRGWSRPLLKNTRCQAPAAALASWWSLLCLCVPSVSGLITGTETWGRVSHLCRFSLSVDGFDDGGLWQWGQRTEGMKGSSCTNISISFFSLPGSEDVTLRPSGTTTTWLFEPSMTSLPPSIRKTAN